MQEEQTPEIWKIISGFENYSVSTHGRVRRERESPNAKVGKIKVIQTNPVTGYCHVKVSGSEGKRSMSLHRLVAEAFIPNPEEKREVDHVDRDKANNHVDNLRWTTREENMIYYRGYNGKAVIATSPAGEEFEFESIRLAAKFIGGLSQGIGNVLGGRNPHYKKWSFRYRDGK